MIPHAITALEGLLGLVTLSYSTDVVSTKKSFRYFSEIFRLKLDETHAGALNRFANGEKFSGFSSSVNVAAVFLTLSHPGEKIPRSLKEKKKCS